MDFQRRMLLELLSRNTPDDTSEAVQMGLEQAVRAQALRELKVSQAKEKIVRDARVDFASDQTLERMTKARALYLLTMRDLAGDDVPDSERGALLRRLTYWLKDQPPAIVNALKRDTQFISMPREMRETANAILDNPLKIIQALDGEAQGAPVEPLDKPSSAQDAAAGEDMAPPPVIAQPVASAPEVATAPLEKPADASQEPIRVPMAPPEGVGEEEDDTRVRIERALRPIFELGASAVPDFSGTFAQFLQQLGITDADGNIVPFDEENEDSERLYISDKLFDNHQDTVLFEDIGDKLTAEQGDRMTKLFEEAAEIINDGKVAKQESRSESSSESSADSVRVEPDEDELPAAAVSDTATDYTDLVKPLLQYFDSRSPTYKLIQSWLDSDLRNDPIPLFRAIRESKDPIKGDFTRSDLLAQLNDDETTVTRQSAQQTGDPGSASSTAAVVDERATEPPSKSVYFPLADRLVRNVKMSTKDGKQLREFVEKWKEDPKQTPTDLREYIRENYINLGVDLKISADDERLVENNKVKHSFLEDIISDYETLVGSTNPHTGSGVRKERWLAMPFRSPQDVREDNKTLRIRPVPGARIVSPDGKTTAELVVVKSREGDLSVVFPRARKHRKSDGAPTGKKTAATERYTIRFNPETGAPEAKVNVQRKGSGAAASNLRGTHLVYGVPNEHGIVPIMSTVNGLVVPYDPNNPEPAVKAMTILGRKTPLQMNERVGGVSWWDVGRFFTGLIPVVGAYATEGLNALETGTAYDAGRATAHAGTSLATSLLPGSSLIAEGAKALGANLVDGAIDKAIGDRKGAGTDAPKKGSKYKIREKSRKRGLTAKKASTLFKTKES